jgi:hypothetical protein
MQLQPLPCSFLAIFLTRSTEARRKSGSVFEAGKMCDARYVTRFHLRGDLERVKGDDFEREKQ